jgi:hypothetical protein
MTAQPRRRNASWSSGRRSQRSLAGDRADAVDERQQRVTSLRLPPVSVMASGIPERSTAWSPFGHNQQEMAR